METILAKTRRRYISDSGYMFIPYYPLFLITLRHLHNENNNTQITIGIILVRYALLSAKLTVTDTY